VIKSQDSLQEPETGRPTENHHRIINGSLWKVRTGESWRDIPQEIRALVYHTQSILQVEGIRGAGPDILLKFKPHLMHKETWHLCDDPEKEQQKGRTI